MAFYELQNASVEVCLSTLEEMLTFAILQQGRKAFLQDVLHTVIKII